MRWLFRVSLFLGFLGLAVLAALPYWPRIQEEVLLLHQAWKQVRAEETDRPGATDAAAESSEPAEPAITRSRKVITPDQLTDTVNSESEEADPFLTEARRRAEEDPEAAMQWLQSQSSGSERLRGMLEVVALWAAEDSESALLWLESNAQGLARLETLNNGVELWAQRAPTEAAAWIDGMANDGSKATAAKSLAAKWAETDAEAAADWVAGLPDGPIRDQAEAALAESWSRLDPEAASIWAFAQAEFVGNAGLLASTIQTYTRQSPEEAEAFLREMVEATDSPAILESHLLARAEQDPASTAQWLAALSPDDPIYSDRYATGLMQVWAESDSIAASEWLSQMPEGAQRDAAVYGFSESMQRFEPEAAAAWANTISDPERRLSRLQASVRNWAEIRPVEAMEWVKSAELEPGLRQELAREIPWD